MSSLQLVEFAASENHVKFRSLLGEMLYARLSEQIKEKTKDMVAEIFDTERVDDMTPLIEYVGEVILATETALETELTEEEINETTNYILSLLEEKDEDDDKKKKKMKKEEDDEDGDEDGEEDEGEDGEEDEDDEEEDEEEEAEDEDAPVEDAEKKAAKDKASTVVHVDMQGAHKTTINKNGNGKKK